MTYHVNGNLDIKEPSLSTTAAVNVPLEETMSSVTTKSEIVCSAAPSTLSAKSPTPPQPPRPPQPWRSPQPPRLPQPRPQPSFQVQRLNLRPPPPPKPEDVCSIHRVPHRVREVKPIAYEPNVISIGPYHYGKDHLRAMEVLKRSCFAKILETKILEYSKFENAMKILKDRVRKCYEGPIPHDLDKNSKDFIDMMIYDGCFIVRLIRDGYFEDVCKLGRHIKIDMWYDLLLLENQLPFFVLLELDRIMTKNSNRTETNPMEDLSSAALSFFQKESYGLQIWSRRGTSLISSKDINHLLHLVYKCCHPSHRGIEQHKKYSQAVGMECRKFIRSATELNDAGIDFIGKKVLQDQDQGLFDIVFTKGPICTLKILNKVMEIPTLRVDDNMERVLRNLLAYEQFTTTGNPTYVYDYVVLMDNLINTDKDVQLLCTRGVIENWLGDDEAVAQMFNKLRDKVYTSDILTQSFYYAEIFYMVDKHCKQKLNKYMAKLRKDYFSSPWSYCSVAAALVLLVVALVQTVYACISYYHPK